MGKMFTDKILKEIERLGKATYDDLYIPDHKAGSIRKQLTYMYKNMKLLARENVGSEDRPKYEYELNVKAKEILIEYGSYKTYSLIKNIGTNEKIYGEND